MRPTTESRALADDHVGEAAAVLARAFIDDPLFIWIEPDEERRARSLVWLMETGSRYGARFGEVHGTVGALRGAAVWLPPGASTVDPGRLEQAGFVNPAAVLGDTGLERFGRFMEHAESLHLRDMPEPHWYLMILGVDPPFQGLGLGGAIMQPVVERADSEGLPCYLDTSKERNLVFYRKHGFEVVQEGTIPGGGPRFWTMSRAARQPEGTGSAG